jgi:FkbM family methyltransferase
VLSLFNRDVDIPAVVETLRESGFRRIVPFVDLHADFCDELGDRFWLTSRSVLTNHEAEIKEAETIWADETSRTLFRRLVEFRRSGAYHEAVKPSQQGTQYFPSDVPGWLRRGPLRFVDCGAYNGDTLGAILTLHLPIEALALFEPDRANFEALARFVSDHHETIGAPVTLWPCAVGSECRTVNFREGFGEGSSLATDGPATVPSVALDRVLFGWRPTFIKMDIEGAERDGLLGARQQIAASQPDLAVCIYHRPGHLWEIPLLLREWKEMENYRYYLRVHGHEGFDTVLYARSDEVKRDRS